ncbi:hypothetical protein SAMN02927921_02909 [Sinomicrobium oceani]|uniref:Uracil phosphoribosyltransferase n=1 Tax=Sinomicrobium oceani TaxID=1150368 RepID=A0A1K1QWR8_9FLAO|nr:uracil phosphoribosyltransferase [Sinomicrobium oceani]SFW64075.1 hypothetical protein SAMN02927921_02909 [Sinomicrobium oceani]
MKDFLDSIQYLFEHVLFLPLNWLRNVELENWWAANALNWIFIIICMAALVYWVMQLKKYNDAGEGGKDISAHSFLK